MRSPFGSKSGSSEAVPGIHSPKISTSTLVPGAAAGDTAHDLTAGANRLGAERDRAWIVEHQAGEPAGGLVRSEQSVPPGEVALVELDRETEACLEGRVLGADVGAPHAVALLEPERVDRLVPARHETMLATAFLDRVPEAKAIFDRAIELPAELAHVGDPQRETGHRADSQLARPHVGERELVCRQRLEDRPGSGPPEPEARVPRGHVLDLHAVGRV